MESGRIGLAELSFPPFLARFPTKTKNGLNTRGTEHFCNREQLFIFIFSLRGLD